MSLDRKWEFEEKRKRLNEFMDKQGYDAVLLRRVSGFAWLSCGGDSHVATDSEKGEAALYATRDGVACLTSNIEAARMAEEELDGLPIPVEAAPWHTGIGELVGRRMEGLKVASDTHFPNAHKMAEPLKELRFSLLEPEIERYRGVGRAAVGAMEQACRTVAPGMTEHIAAGLLDGMLRTAGLTPLVTLAGADDRLDRYRHPIPTSKRISRVCMLVTCARRHGLIVALTRMVHFGTVPDDLQDRLYVASSVEAVMHEASRPGMEVSRILLLGADEYGRHGFQDEWTRHHQGGGIGYETREFIANPDCTRVVQENQAFAWNPSLPGAKCEDTILVTGDGTELLTLQSDDWPTIDIAAAGGMQSRPGILQR